MTFFSMEMDGTCCHMKPYLQTACKVSIYSITTTWFILFTTRLVTVLYNFSYLREFMEKIKSELLDV